MGILVHWLVSSRLVFADGTAARGSGERHRQKLLFVGSALVGLAVTTAIVGAGSALGLDPRLAKLAAILVRFQTTYLLRRHIVFRQDDRTDLGEGKGVSVRGERGGRRSMNKKK